MSPLQLLGVALLLIFIVFLGKLIAIGGYENFNEVPQDIIASTAMMVMFIMLLIGSSGAQGLLSLFQTLCNGIPGVSAIMDFGSFSDMWRLDPIRGVEMFLDTMLVSFFMNMTGKLFLLWNQNTKSYRRVLDTVAKVFLSLVIAVVVTVFIVNVLMKATGVYRLAVNFIAGLIMAVTAPGLLNPVLKISLRQKIDTTIFLATIVAFWDSWIVKQFRKAILDAFLYCAAAFLLEKIFGSLQNIVSLGTSLIAAFAPCAVMIFGIWMMLQAGLPRK